MHHQRSLCPVSHEINIIDFPAHYYYMLICLFYNQEHLHKSKYCDIVPQHTSFDNSHYIKVGLADACDARLSLSANQSKKSF